MVDRKLVRQTAAAALALGLALGVAMPAAGKEKRKPPPPCPLTANLRIANLGSIAGLGSLAGCSPEAITVAPASPSEYVEPRNRRIAPIDDGMRPAFTRVVAASEPATRSPRRSEDEVGLTRVARIAPLKDEPVELAAAMPVADANGMISPEAILAMRPISYTTPYDAMITRVAERHRVDPLLLHAVITQESRYRVNATSHVGARGLMQLMPGTARMLGVSAITDAEANVDGGARLLRQLHGRFGDFNLTLAAYNAGEGAVRKYGNQVPPYRETQNYVRQVMANYNRLVTEQRGAGR